MPRRSIVARGATVLVLLWLATGCGSAPQSNSTAGTASPGTSGASATAACGPSRYPGQAQPTGRRSPAATTIPAGQVAPMPSTTQPPAAPRFARPASSPPSQEDLYEDLVVVDDYGVAHSDEYTGIRYDDDGGPVIVALFTGHVDEHLAALRAKVAHPDHVRVRQACRTAVDLQAIRDEISLQLREDGRHLMESMGSNMNTGKVRVDLKANGESVARSLHERYGEAVQLMVGDWPYPYSTSVPSTMEHAADQECPTTIDRFLDLRLAPPKNSTVASAVDGGSGYHAPRRGSVDGLTMNLVIDQPPTEKGGEFKGHVTYTNGGSVPLTVDDHAEFALLVDSQHRVVSVHTGSQTTDGRWTTIAPGQSHDVPIVGDTGTCVPNAGYTLASGRYGVVIVPTIAVGDTTPGGPTGNGNSVIVVSPEGEVVAP